MSFSKMMYYFTELKYFDENFVYIYQNPLSTEGLEKQEESTICEHWIIKGNAEIQSMGFGRSTRGHAVYVEGNNILDMYLGLDESACVLSSVLAESIFGSGNIIGEEVQYKEEKYVVKGIIYEESPILFLNPSKRNMDLQAKARVAMVRNVGELNYINIENMFHNGDEKVDVDFMKWFVQLLLYIFFLWTFVVLLKACWNYSKNKWLNVTVLSVFWMILIKTFVMGTYVFPIRILPGKCSDFEGWINLAGFVSRQFSCIVRHKELPVIDCYYRGFYGCIFYLIFTGVLLKSVKQIIREDESL